MQKPEKEAKQEEAPPKPGRVAVMSTKNIISYQENILRALQRVIKPRAIRHTSGLTLTEYQAIINFKPE